MKKFIIWSLISLGYLGYFIYSKRFWIWSSWIDYVGLIAFIIGTIMFFKLKVKDGGN